MLNTYLQDGRIAVLPETHQDVGLSCCPKIDLANPLDYSSGKPFLFTFGAVGSTFVLAWGRGVEDALEEAAEWLAEYAPGHLCQPEYDEACSELYPGRDLASLTEDEQERVHEAAEADLTYTESGWLVSYEWFVSDAEQSAATDAALVELYQDGQLEPYFDRCDVCAAWNLWLQSWHGGQDSKEYARLSKLSGYFTPSRSAEMVEGLPENAAGIYARLLVKSLGGEV